jgi:hypothetical protein
MQLAGLSNPFAVITIVPNSAETQLKGIVDEMITAGMIGCKSGIVYLPEMP